MDKVNRKESEKANKEEIGGHHENLDRLGGGGDWPGHDGRTGVGELYHHSDF